MNEKDLSLKKVSQRYKLGFTDLQILKQALTHTSYAHENAHSRGDHNERLEFLGDAVLELIVSQYLFKNYPQMSEGELTRLRSSLVCESSLVKVARNLGLGKYIYLGRGELRAGGRSRSSILADTVEALIGAIYLEKGFDFAYQTVLDWFKPVSGDLKNGIYLKDFKTMVQEFAQQNYNLTPEYRIVKEMGPDHDKVFVAQVLFHQEIWGQGKGKNKKEAEQAAASRAWKRMKDTTV